LMILLGVLALSGCGPQPQSASNKDGQTRIFDTQRDALEKAKSINETVMQGDRALRAQEEAQGK
jgi:hypothetical protein